MRRGLRCRPWRASARLRPPPCHAMFSLASFLPILNRIDYIAQLAEGAEAQKAPAPYGAGAGNAKGCC